MTALPSSIRLPRPTPSPSRPLSNRLSRQFNQELAMLVARCVALRPRGGRQLQPADLEDTVQQLVLIAFEAWPRFDESRGKARTFISRVMRRRLASQTRRRLAQKRGGLRQRVSFEDAIDAVVVADEKVATQRRIDVEAVVATLPAELQLICRLLKEYTVAEVARQLHLTRSAVEYRISCIRSHFISSGVSLLDGIPPASLEGST